MVKQAKERFDEFLSKYGKSKIAIVTHSRADADAIASAYVLSRILKNSIICSSEEMREGARQLTERLRIEIKDLNFINKNDIDGIAVVDTSTYVLTAEAKGWKILGIIDHHRIEGKDMNGEFEIIDRESPSTAEILANIIDADEIDKEMAFALSVGIISDGARFKSARANTFETLGRFMKKADADYLELLDIAEPEPKQEAKVAILKTMKNLEFVYVAGHVIVTGEADSNESDAASIITDAADVAFIANWKNKEQETRISARAMKSTKIPLNKVMAEVGKELDGAGGGHPKAAGASVKAHTKEALEKCVEVFIKAAEEISS